MDINHNDNWPEPLDGGAHLDTKYQITLKDRRLLGCEPFDRCGMAICLSCGTRKAQYHKGVLRRQLQKISRVPEKDQCNVYYVVLTLRREPDLKAQVTTLYESMRTLRKSKYWRDRVLGGCYRLHTEYDRDKNVWGAHLDCLIEGDSLSRRGLVAMWTEITKTSTDVGFQPVPLTPPSIHSLSSYVMKLLYFPYAQVKRVNPHLQIENLHLLRRYEADTGRRRKFQRFGTWLKRRNCSSKKGGGPAT